MFAIISNLPIVWFEFVLWDCALSQWKACEDRLWLEWDLFRGVNEVSCKIYWFPSINRNIAIWSIVTFRLLFQKDNKKIVHPFHSFNRLPTIVRGILGPFKWRTKCMRIRYLFLSNDLFIQQLIVAEWEGTSHEWSVPYCLEETSIVHSLSMNGSGQTQDDEEHFQCNSMTNSYTNSIKRFRTLSMGTNRTRQIGAQEVTKTNLSSWTR